MTDLSGRILVVDDNENNRDLVARRLKKHGHDVEVAVGGYEALDRLTAEAFDTVLLDVMMPEIDGVETLRRIRKTWGKHELPVIMVTAKDDSETVVKTLQDGANDYVTKPIDFPVLFARVNNQLALRFAELRLIQANEVLEERVLERTAALQEANDKLLQSEEHLRAVLDNAADGIVSIDSRGNIRSVNHSAQLIFGYDQADVVGRHISMLMPEETAAGQGWSLQGETGGARPVGKAGRGVRILTGKRKSGVSFPVEVSLGEIKTPEEHLFIGVLRDITDRTDLEKQLRQAQKMEAIGRLTGGVAHDFNNLLTVIMGNLQLLERSLSGEEKAKSRVDKIMSASKSGAELTRRLLSFSRQQVLDTKTVDISELVGDMDALLRRTLGEDIALLTFLSQEPCLGTTDRNQLEHALLNLCINARDAMPDGGRLTIETRRTYLDESYAASRWEVEPGAYVEIGVSDTGCGIPPEILEKIFEPFFTTKDEGKGTGLGLATIFGFMKQSGGHIGVYSEVGHGTTFKLYVPEAPGAVDEDPAEMEVDDCTEEISATILIVEDDERVREIAVSILAEEGYHIIEAENGPTALAAFHEHPEIAMVFTDVIMPGGMTGPELVEEIRQSRPDMPALFASGYAEQALRNRETLLASSKFISKPYNVTELPRHIKSVLEAVQ